MAGDSLLLLLLRRRLLLERRLLVLLLVRHGRHQVLAAWCLHLAARVGFAPLFGKAVCG
jgi:hypothetical protein